MSEATSPQLPAAALLRFAQTFTPGDHPQFLLLTGGEPLLRPGLIRELALTARSAGTRSYVLTGAFFARSPRFPSAITEALESVDHVCVSIDAFHEERLPREHAFRVLRAALEAGRDVSVQTCGTEPDDPYLADLIRQLVTEFGGRVPVLVSRLHAVGRAREWLAGSRADRPVASPPAVSAPVPASPCDLVSWPVVGFDGTITACCNPEVVDSGEPAHLRIGHVRSMTWPQVRQAVISSPMLRGLRTRGPLRLAGRHGGPGGADEGYCRTCQLLSSRPDVIAAAEADAARPQFALIERQAVIAHQAAGAAAFAGRHGDPAWAGAVLAGNPGAPAAITTSTGTPAGTAPAEAAP
jgi:hypothetical protein